MPKGSAARAHRASLVVATTAAFAGLTGSACTWRPRPVPGWPTTTVPGTTAPTTTTTAPAADPGDPGAGHPIFDAGRIHQLAITFDQAEYDAMIATFRDTGEKEWIRATVTIDGATYEDAGIRLKGNSSLSGIRRPNGMPELPPGWTPPAGWPPVGGGPGGPPGGIGGITGGATAETPEKLPWLIKLNEFVKGQKHEGRRELVVRSNPTQTSLNEALSLELLARAGLAYQLSAPYALTVNGERRALRLVTDNPEKEWEAEHFDTPGILYKAEAGGDYSYRGHDPAAYDEIFDQETGDDNFVPLMDFLQFINQSSDADFAAQLPDRFDIQAFADYLAFEDLIGNWDDIEGPGNNSYLRWNEPTNSFTIVAWDHNLAFSGGGGGFPGGGFPPPGGGFPGGGFPGGGFPGRSNPLVTRFKAVPEFKALYDASLARLRADLFSSGVARQILDRRAAVLRAGAGDLVPAVTVDQEVQRIVTQLSPR